MLTYEDIYELSRKEKYSETLQQLPKNFLLEFKEFMETKRSFLKTGSEILKEPDIKLKRQIENSVTIFKELLLRRKRKLLSLAFVATETGIMKKDYENMLDFEKKIFEKIVLIFEEGDKDLANTLGKNSQKIEANKMILFNQNIEQFINHEGELIGPFKEKEFANINEEIAKILVAEGKAAFIEEE